jgi:hypothetical protein
MPIEPPDYYQTGYPVLSFSYALFTDQDFSEREHTRWQAAPETYRGFLDNYSRDSSSRFPQDAADMIATTVPSNGANSAGFYFPTPNQARIAITRIFEEIKAATVATRTATDRSLAQLGGDRPVLRILAVIFTNQPSDPGLANVPAQIDTLGNAPLQDALRKLVGFRKGALTVVEAMTPAVTEPVTAALVDEFIAAPAEW